eukprot:CAMPEP_0118881990 /NCGR_PEP_ID=MMETSP1163-20130328/21356_1 /TAXON_ID=124430 /ORGANISM="Phaeomonas parva, Strain CCMP2877" /LENGTH=305 /DNA_ID=CAMNT_0006818927 /DNA_START=229 /DNA_END=1143 /DNA_ORIENTATION=-
MARAVRRARDASSYEKQQQPRDRRSSPPARPAAETDTTETSPAVTAAMIVAQSERRALKKVRAKLERASALLAKREEEVAGMAARCEQRAWDVDQELLRVQEERDVARVEATVAREALLVVEEENAQLRRALDGEAGRRAGDGDQKLLVAKTLGEVKEALELASDKVAKAEIDNAALRRENNALKKEMKEVRVKMQRQDKQLTAERRRRRRRRAKWRDATARIGQSVRILQHENQAAAANIGAATRTIEELSAAAAAERQQRQRLEMSMDRIRSERSQEREGLGKLERQRARALEKRLQIESALC